MLLNDHWDQKMSQFKCVRSKNSLTYLRKIGDAIQEFIIAFARNPSYANNAIAHITPLLCIKNKTISDLALSLVDDPLLLANAPEI